MAMVILGGRVTSELINLPLLPTLPLRFGRFGNSSACAGRRRADEQAMVPNHQPALTHFRRRVGGKVWQAVSRIVRVTVPIKLIQIECDFTFT